MPSTRTYPAAELQATALPESVMPTAQRLLTWPDAPPVTVTADGRLVDGRRRLADAVTSNIQTVTAAVMPAADDASPVDARLLAALRLNWPARGRFTTAERGQIINSLMSAGMEQRDIAAALNISQGRVSQLRTAALMSAPVSANVTAGRQDVAASALAWAGSKARIPALMRELTSTLAAFPPAAAISGPRAADIARDLRALARQLSDAADTLTDSDASADRAQ